MVKYLEAFKIIISLAEQNKLSYTEAKNNDLAIEYFRQDQAFFLMREAYNWLEREFTNGK